MATPPPVVTDAALQAAVVALRQGRTVMDLALAFARADGLINWRGGVVRLARVRRGAG